MTNQPQITIVGLGLIGTSFGLALKRQKEVSFVITGHDPSDPAVQRAKKLGAIDTSHWNLVKACEKADLILLALPLAAIAPALQTLRTVLKPGCLILDTAPLKAPVLEAAKVLPDSVYFVSSTPVILKPGPLGVEAAAADLFDKTPWTLCPTPTTPPEAVSTAADLVRLVGSQPFFLDPAEHDGLMAAVDGLPTLLAAALLRTTSGNPSWREMRRLAGGHFEAATYLPGVDPADLGALLLGNSDNLAHWIDVMVAELQDWKQTLQDGDEKVVASRFEAVTESRYQWLGMRAQGDFEEPESREKLPGFWGRLVTLPSRRPPAPK